MRSVARPTIAVLEREVIKLMAQRGRLLSAMARPLLWLLVIGSGFGAMQDRHPFTIASALSHVSPW